MKTQLVAREVPVGQVFEVLEGGRPTGRLYERLGTLVWVGPVTARRVDEAGGTLGLVCEVGPNCEVRRVKRA